MVVTRSRPQGEQVGGTSHSQQQQPSSSGTAAAPPSIPMDPDYPGIRFASTRQFEKFQKLKTRPFVPTRFLHRPTLDALGIADPLYDFMRAAKMKHWFSMWYMSFHDYTYEFLSSVRQVDGENGKVLKFRLGSVNRTLTYTEFCDAFRFTHEDIPRYNPRTELFHQLWPRIAQTLYFPNIQYSLASVQHPVLRMFLKFMKEGVFAAKDSHKLHSPELFVVGRVLLNAELSIPSKLWDYLVKVPRNSSAICCGGLITRIAVYFNLPDPSVANAENLRTTALTLQHLQNAGFITPSPHKWRCFFNVSGTTEYLTLPFAQGSLPPLDRNLPSYLLLDAPIPEYPVPGLPPPAVQDPNYLRNARRQGGRPHVVNLNSDDEEDPGNVGAGNDEDDHIDDAPYIPTTTTYAAPSGSQPIGSDPYYTGPSSSSFVPPPQHYVDPYGPQLVAALADIRETQLIMRETQMDQDRRIRNLEHGYQCIVPPIYDWCSRAHIIPPSSPLPPFCPPPRPEDSFSIDLSRGFDRLRLVDDAGHSYRYANAPPPSSPPTRQFMEPSYGGDWGATRGAGTGDPVLAGLRQYGDDDDDDDDNMEDAADGAGDDADWDAAADDSDDGPGDTPGVYYDGGDYSSYSSYDYGHTY